MREVDPRALSRNNKSQGRRRLSDKWEDEEEEMDQEIQLFFEEQMARGSVGDGQVQGKEYGMLRNSQERKVQQATPLPPVSSNCTDPSGTLPCPSESLPAVCDKYNDAGNFKECYEQCKPSYCCVHDATVEFAQTCAKTEQNCRNYIPCYIIWWKLADTIGPANNIRVEQDDDFFLDVTFNYVFTDWNAGGPESNELFLQVFQHHTITDDYKDTTWFQDPANWV
jgi:hypothetical protein